MQRDRRAPDTAALRRRLLAGAAAVALAASGSLAHAQTAPTPTPAPNVAGPDGLTPDAVYIEADSATRQGDVITASGVDAGRVLARFRGSTLRAGEISYDLAQGVATANRQVEFRDAGGTVIFASYLELDSDMKAGVAVDLASRFANGGSLMAATAVRRSEHVNELNYAIFTPCPICDAEGNPKQPSISIQAEKVVQNEELRAVLYRNAVFRLGGVPVLYLPYFAHPDPTVERASGFLVPIPSYDDGRGLSLEMPYLRVISPSEDWLISPQFNTDVAPFLNLQWRRRFSNAMLVARVGYTYEENFGDFDGNDPDSLPDIPIEAEHRSYFLTWGRWDPEGPWRAGFTAERTSDKTLFDRYDIHDPYQDNGLYYGDRRRLAGRRQPPDLGSGRMAPDHDLPRRRAVGAIRRPARRRLFDRRPAAGHGAGGRDHRPRARHGRSGRQLSPDPPPRRRRRPDSGADGPVLGLQRSRPGPPHSERGQPDAGAGPELPVPDRPVPRLRPAGGRPALHRRHEGHHALGSGPAGQPVHRPQRARRRAAGLPGARARRADAAVRSVGSGAHDLRLGRAGQLRAVRPNSRLGPCDDRFGGPGAPRRSGGQRALGSAQSGDRDLHHRPVKSGRGTAEPQL